ncbi:hypothetical protein HanIR_Chr16g0804261 [Helianthus annuus]|nr:hypothetical protein HanIR_Chr16g0804261 [Helianthus annuus]
MAVNLTITTPNLSLFIYTFAMNTRLDGIFISPYPFIHTCLFANIYTHTTNLASLYICILEPKFIIIILEFRSQVHISYIFVPSLIFMVTTRLFQAL